MYVVEVLNSARRVAFYPLVIRSKAPADFTVIVPQFTWQAYNDYGGSSLYTIDPSTGKTVPAVSFERPYGSHGGATMMVGRHEGSALRWLERNGFGVNYISDVDLADSSKTFPRPLKGFIFLGHSEYWNLAEYKRVEQLRDSGEHLVFLGANNAYWNVHLFQGAYVHRSGTVVWCAKGLTDPRSTNPEDVTVRFRDYPLNRPENGLYGIMFGGRLAMPNSDYYALTANDSAIGPDAAAFLSAAGIAPHESIPGVLGTEDDQVVNNGHTPVGLQVLFRSTSPAADGAAPIVAHSTFFVAPSGAGIFATGSNEWSAGLDALWGSESPKLELLTKSVLDWMLTH